VIEPPEGGVTEAGDKVQVTPAGHEAVKSTTELNPFNDPTVIVEVPELPCWIVREPCDADKEKSASDGAVTVRLTVVEWGSEPLVPVTVRV